MNDLPLLETFALIKMMQTKTELIMNYFYAEQQQ